MWSILYKYDEDFLQFHIHWTMEALFFHLQNHHKMYSYYVIKYND